MDETLTAKERSMHKSDRMANSMKRNLITSYEAVNSGVSDSAERREASCKVFCIHDQCVPDDIKGIGPWNNSRKGKQQY